MRKNKLKNIEQANIMLEQSYLRSKGLLKEDNFGFWPDEEKSEPKHSWEDKWRKVEEIGAETKKEMENVTQQTPILVYKPSKGNSNFLITTKDGKFYLYSYINSQNMSKPEEFGDLESAKKGITKP